MNRAQAYELAKARGFNKSISAFGGQFTRNPEAVVCGIKRIDKGVFIEVEEEVKEEASSSASSSSDNTLITAGTQLEAPPLRDEEELTEDSDPKDTPEATTQKENLPPQQKLTKEADGEETAEATTQKDSLPRKQELSEDWGRERVPDSDPEDTPEEDQKDNRSLKQMSNDSQGDDKKSPRQHSDRPPRIRRKLYTANGTHQAICRFQGVLMPKPEGEKGFRLLLPGLEVEAHFAFPKTLWYYRQNPQIFEGVKNYIGYPKLTGDGKLVKIQIVAIDQEQSFQKEQWEFIGMWCGPQKALFVQRQGQMFPDEERPHYYKYRFKNQDEYRKYLWDRYAYQIIAKREGEELLIVRNNPFACPRRKPEPPVRGGGRPPMQGRPPTEGGRPSIPSKPSLQKPSTKPQPRNFESRPPSRSLPTLDS